MGEISAPPASSTGKPKRKNLSTRVDLTPMVDLGFLLITFFIFTASMTEPRAMKLIVPDDAKKTSSVYSEDKTLNIIIDNGNLFAYDGIDKDEIKNVRTTIQIRQLIIEKKKQLQHKFGSGNELMVLVKPTMNADYESIVNILDEMSINDIKRYVFMEPADNEIPLQ